LVGPFGIILGAFALVVVIVGAISRVLLAVNKDASVVVAITCAVLVLLIFTFIATRAHVSRASITAIVAIAGVGLVGAGIAAAAKGERKPEERESGITELQLTAKDTNFNTKSLDAPAVFLLAMVMSGCVSNAPQDALDPQGHESRTTYHLFKPVFWIAVGVFILVEGLIVLVVVRFRRRSDDESPLQIHGSRSLETAW